MTYDFWINFVFGIVVLNFALMLIQCRFIIRFTGSKNKIIYYLIFGIISFAMLFTSLLPNIPDLYATQDVATLIGLAVIVLFIKFALKQSFMLSAVTAVLVITANVLVESLIALIQRRIVETYSLQESVAMQLISVVMLILTYFIFVFFEKKIQNKQNQKYMIILLAPLLFILIAMRMVIAQKFSFYPNPIYTQDMWPYIMITALAFVCVYIVIMAYNKVMDYVTLEKQKAILEEYATMQKKYMDEAVLRYKTTAAFRHDFKNHIIALKGLLKTKNVERAQEYLQRFEEASQVMSLEITTGNTAVDALFNEKINYAKQMGIRVDCNVVIPKVLKIDDFELCIIFANILDNAIKACNTVEDEVKFIESTASLTKDFFIIVVKNNYKNGCNNEGLGLKNVKGVLEKYDGVMEIKDSNNIFVVSIIIPN